MIIFGTPPAVADVRSISLAADDLTAPTSTRLLIRSSAVGVVWGLTLGTVGSLITAHRLDATLLATAAAGTAVGLLYGLYRAYRRRADGYDHSLGSMVVTPGVVTSVDGPAGGTVTVAPIESGDVPETQADDVHPGDTADDDTDDGTADGEAVWPGAACRPIRPSYEAVRAELGELVAAH